AKTSIGPVCVPIAKKQCGLKEEQAGCPHRGRPTEPGKDRLGGDRLHLEEQERTKPDCDGVEHEASVSHHYLLCGFGFPARPRGGLPFEPRDQSLRISARPSMNTVARSRSSSLAIDFSRSRARARSASIVCFVVSK